MIFMMYKFMMYLWRNNEFIAENMKAISPYPFYE